MGDFSLRKLAGGDSITTEKLNVICYCEKSSSKLDGVLVEVLSSQAQNLSSNPNSVIISNENSPLIFGVY